MEFEYSKRTKEYIEQLQDFMNKHLYPNEQTFQDQLSSGSTRWQVPPIMEDTLVKNRFYREQAVQEIFSSAIVI